MQGWRLTAQVQSGVVSDINMRTIEICSCGISVPPRRYHTLSLRYTAGRPVYWPAAAYAGLMLATMASIGLDPLTMSRTSTQVDGHQ